jgi:hypothetical protein
VVFGSTLRIVRLGEGSRMEVRQFGVTPPIDLDNRVMDGDTFCPNGKSLKTLQPPAWDAKWLRAADPPAPPKCVPSRTAYCPPE